MKRLFIFASLGAFLAAAPALAADDHHDGQQGTTPPTHQAHTDHGAGHTGGPAGHMAGGPAGGHMGGPTGPMSGPIAPATHGAMITHHDHMQPAVNNAMAHSNAPSGMGHNNMGHNNMGHGGNFAALHRNFTAPHRYHASNYHRPHGYYAHRWTFGERLPSAFFVRDYWIDDFDDYGLMDPPPGTVWVRYGDDALLIDEYTGEVIEVEYDVFY